MELLKKQEEFINLLKKDLNNSNINKKSYYIKGNKGAGKKYLLNYIEYLFNEDKNISTMKIFLNEEETTPFECLKEYNFIFNDKIHWNATIKAFFLNINIFESKKCTENSKNSKNYIINKVEKKFKNKTLIIIINNIQNLQLCTKKLIEELFNSSNLKFKNIFIIFTSNESIDIDINYEEYKLELTKDDIEKTINSSIIEKFKLEELLKFIDDNIALMKICNQFIDINEESLNNLLEKFIDIKLKNIKIEPSQDKYHEIKHFLQEISILNNNILEEYFQIIDRKDKINEYLNISKKLNFMEQIKNKEKEYYFYEFIKQYSYNCLNFEKKKLYRKLDDYFKSTAPQYYVKRSNYLIKSNEFELIEKGLYLSLLNYTDIYKTERLFIKDKIYNNNKIDNKKFGYSKYKRFYKDKQNYEKAINNIFESNFQEALSNLNIISVDIDISTAFTLEILRNRILCYYMLKDYDRLVKTSEVLYNKIIKHEENENDQICKSIILLIGIFANNLNDKEKVKRLKDEFEKIYKKYIDNEYFEYFKVELDRRTCIFDPLHISKLKLKECIGYFQNNDGYIFETYYTMVNYICVCLIHGDFIEFDKYYKKCRELEKKYPTFNLQKEQKLTNNNILKEYLLHEKSLNNESKDLLVHARKSLDQLKEIKRKTENISKVVDFNIINFCLLCNEINEAEKLSNELEPKIPIEDVYYIYFLINLKIMLYYLKNDRTNAIEYFKKLESIDFKNTYFFEGFENILEKRKGLLNEILNKEETLSQLELNKFFLKGRLTDPEYYYCRPFLISDLQYLSI